MNMTRTQPFRISYGVSIKKDSKVEYITFYFCHLVDDLIYSRHKVDKFQFTGLQLNCLKELKQQFLFMRKV